jgi:ATP-binding cassette, subfamily B, bacterial
MPRRRRNVSTTDLLPSLARLLRAFRAEIRPQRGLIVFSFAAMLFSIGARLLEPWPLKFILDWVVVPASGGQAVTAGDIPALVSAEPALALVLLVVALVVVVTGRALAAYLATVTMALAATRSVTRIRARLFAHIQELSLAFHHKARSGDLVNRFTYDVERLREVAVTAALPLAVSVVTIVAMLGVMFAFQWQLALIALAVLPLSHLATLRMGTRIQKISREQRERDGAVAAAAAETIGAIKQVQALSLSRLFNQAFAKQNKRSLKQGAKAQRLAARLETKVEVLLAIATALVLWRGSFLVMEGSLSVGMLLVFVMYLNHIFRPVRQMAKYLAKVSRATASGERVLEILDTMPDIRDRPGAVAVQGVKGSIEFHDVCFAYGKGQSALDSVSLRIAAGERVALVGPSGGGKSTILGLILRLYDPDCGRVSIDGRDLRELKVESLRQQISVILQDSILFAVSMRDNIAYGALDANGISVEEAARLANADGFIRALPDDYDTVPGERGVMLSGGQRQRIAVARAMIRQAPILLLDEPTTGLDNVNRAEVHDALEACMRGKTTVLATHDLLAAQSFDRIYLVDQGRIVACGAHDELMRNSSYYRELYERQTTTPTEPTTPPTVEPLWRANR